MAGAQHGGVNAGYDNCSVESGITYRPSGGESAAITSSLRDYEQAYDVLSNGAAREPRLIKERLSHLKRSVLGFIAHLVVVFLLAIMICGASAAPSDSTVVAYSAVVSSQSATAAEAATASVHPGVNGNPWGYNYTCCHLIYKPAGKICKYFHCIGSFWRNTRGYVEQCSDGTISHSGGRSGSCSDHGGNRRPLYQP